MNVNQQIGQRISATKSSNKRASNLFAVFMDTWLERNQEHWEVKAHAIGQGFFVYCFQRTIASIKCKDGSLVVDHCGAYDLGLDPPKAVAGGHWPSWQTPLTEESLELVGKRLLRHIADKAK